MSLTHLNDLRNALERNHWVIAEELSGNDYDISAIWIIQRPDGKNKLHIEFYGLDEAGVLPIDKAYSCRVREIKNINVYFSRPGRSWPSEIEKFIKSLKSVGT